MECIAYMPWCNPIGLENTIEFVGYKEDAGLDHGYNLGLGLLCPDAVTEPTRTSHRPEPWSWLTLWTSLEADDTGSHS